MFTSPTRFKFLMTVSAVTALPFEKCTPSLSVTVHVRPSSEATAPEARQGCTELSSPILKSASVMPYMEVYQP